MVSKTSFFGLSETVVHGAPSLPQQMAAAGQLADIVRHWLVPLPPRLGVKELANACAPFGIFRAPILEFRATPDVARNLQPLREPSGS